jgi:hypothetical protein
MSKIKPLPEFINGFRVIEDLGYKFISGKNRRFVKFECKFCFSHFDRSVEHIKAKTVKGCGCKALKLNPVPREINGFKIIQKLTTYSQNNRHYIAECKVCKKHYRTCLSYLKKANSCGCLWKTEGVPRRLQAIYGSMKVRCNPANINNPSYKRYIIKNITVCDEWANDSHAFYNWALNNGYQEDLTIDRIDNSLGYFPDNCRWATRSQQMRNRDISRFKESDVIYIRNNPDNLSRKQLAQKFNCSEGAICRIINKTRFTDI